MISKKYGYSPANSSYISNNLTKEQEKILEAYSKKMDDDFMKEIYNMKKDYSYYDDYGSYKSTGTTVKEDKISRSLYDSVVRERDQAKSEAREVRDAMDDMTAGNIDIQRALIKIDPHNIRFIKNPYVDVQLEAIMADSTCFSKIRNPSQEAIDAYGFVK